jgi:hypothetical protein
MPSRKSDARRSTAPTVDDDSEMTTSQQDTPIPPAEQLAAATLSSETPAPESNAATSEKGKEKSKERDPDAITIEVRHVYLSYPFHTKQTICFRIMLKS